LSLARPRGAFRRVFGASVVSEAPTARNEAWNLRQIPVLVFFLLAQRRLVSGPGGAVKD